MRPCRVKGIAHLCFFTPWASVLLSFEPTRIEKGACAEGGARPLCAICVEWAACLCCFAPQTNVLTSFRIRKTEEGACPLYVFKFLRGARDLFFLLGSDGLIILSSLPYLFLQGADVLFGLLLKLLVPPPGKLYFGVDLRHPRPGTPVEVS